ncbi:MAG: arginyltransferase [Pirellulales bacterium]
MEPRSLPESYRFTAPPEQCGYLPDRQSTMEYRWFDDLTDEDYAWLLDRGWRRFGELVFRPNCKGCQECRGIRLDVSEFQPSRSHRRTLKRNEDVRVEFAPAEASADHLRIYNAYHADMHTRRGWPLHLTDWSDYHQSFLSGERSFGYEFRYYREHQLIGVALCDVVPEMLSAVYFFHDPVWRPDGPGIFSVLQHVRMARETGRRWVQLGYWVPDCPSMRYKAQFQPHEILEILPPDNADPQWRKVAD